MNVLIDIFKDVHLDYFAARNMHEMEILYSISPKA